MWETILISPAGCDLGVIGTSSSDIWLVDFNKPCRFAALKPAAGVVVFGIFWLRFENERKSRSIAYC